MMEAFLTSNEWPWRLARTVVQGVLGVVVANVDMLVGCAVLTPEWRAVMVAPTIAALSPVMAELGAAPLSCDEPHECRANIRQLLNQIAPRRTSVVIRRVQAAVIQPVRRFFAQKRAVATRPSHNTTTCSFSLPGESLLSSCPFEFFSHPGFL